MENQPEEIVAYMARAAGFDKPYNLTDDQLTTVKGYLEKLKPNVLSFAQQATDSVAAMVSGEAWLITGNIGNEDRVKDGGGPEIKGYVPKEGTVGWHDGEMIVKEGANKALIKPFLELSQQARAHRRELPRRTGDRCSTRRPTGCSSTRARRTRLTATSTASRRRPAEDASSRAPGTSTDKSIQLFNEVFGGG